MLVHQNAIVKFRDDMPLDRAALIGCGVTTGVGAVLNTARIEPGSTVAVFGCGGVGLVGDPGRPDRRRAHDHRRRRARTQARHGPSELGATHVVDASTAIPSRRSAR